MQPDVSIILSFHNAQEYVSTAVEGVHRAFSGADYSFEIIAVQNGSRDCTADLLAGLRDRHRGLRLVSLNPGTGYGAGILQGLAVASGKALGWIRGDSGVPPEAIPRLLKLMNLTCADMGYGYGHLGGGGIDRLIEKLSGFTLADLLGQPKLLTRRAYQSMKLRSQDNFLDAETLLKARRMGAAICRIEVDAPTPAFGLKQSLDLALKLCRSRLLNKDPWGLNATPENILSPATLRRSAAR